MEVVIGTPQRGPYHLALRQANPGTLFTGMHLSLSHPASIVILICPFHCCSIKHCVLHDAYVEPVL